MAKAKKEKPTPNDGGLGQKEKERLRTAIRQVWHWTSYARKLVIKRCLIENGFSKCEACGKICPKISVDHRVPCGEFDYGFIARCFVSSDQLQGLCATCHGRKTREEKKLRDLQNFTR